MTNKDAVIAKVKELIAAPSCYSGLKSAAEAYLASIGKAEQKDAAKKLAAELKADVETIDEVLAFFSSENGVKVFGADTAKSLTEQAKKVKAEGGKYCFCPACAAGKAILDMEDAL